jgi:hypothetical protein
MQIIYTAITLLGIVALAGMYLLSLILRDKQTPKSVTLIHGLFAALSLVLLIVYFFRNESGPLISIIVFSIAAASGIMINYRDITGKTVPKWFAVTHGLLAVTGYAFLLVFAFSK